VALHTAQAGTGRRKAGARGLVGPDGRGWSMPLLVGALLAACIKKELFPWLHLQLGWRGGGRRTAGPSTQRRLAGGATVDRARGRAQRGVPGGCGGAPTAAGDSRMLLQVGPCPWKGGRLRVMPRPIGFHAVFTPPAHTSNRRRPQSSPLIPLYTSNSPGDVPLTRLPFPVLSGGPGGAQRCASSWGGH
jgi:hypothetical protein